MLLVVAKASRSASKGHEVQRMLSSLGKGCVQAKHYSTGWESNIHTLERGASIGGFFWTQLL
eukprot:1495926-Karenia_brevis.AAC.1